ncbi:DNA polymerase I [compost metagenome]
MARTTEEKMSIAQEVMGWCDTVIQEDDSTVVTEYWRGKIIRSTFELYRLRKKLMKVQEYALDTEFTSLAIQGPGKSDLVGVSFSWGKYNNYYVPIYHLEDPTEEQISLQQFVHIMLPVFRRKDVRVIGHNLKAEMHILANHGIEIATEDLFDTMVAVWNLDENNEIGLKEISWRYYNYNQRHFEDILLTIPKEVKANHGLGPQAKGDMSMVYIRYAAPYAMDDTYWTWQIYLDVYDALEEEGALKYFFKRQMPYLRVLYNMERRGFKIDEEKLDEMIESAQRDLDKLRYKIYEIVGVEFNIGSDEQLAMLLYGWKKQKPIYEKIVEYEFDKEGNPVYYKSGPRKGQQKYKEKNNKDVIVGYEDSYVKELVDISYGFPVTSTTATGIPQTNNDCLEAISKMTYKRDRRKIEGQKLVRFILDYKRLEKLYTAFMIGLKEQIYEDGKVHCSFNQCGTSSGRLSCQNPNLQQLPRSLESVKEPNRDKYPTEQEYLEAMEYYKREKAVFDFWIRYEIRSLFIPDDQENYEVLAADFSNLEMRILTHFSQDPLLISMFEREADAHGDTAVNMYKLDCDPDEAKKLYPKQRQAAKTINFLLVYGGSPLALMSQLGVPKKEAQYMYDLYFETYEGVAKFMSGQKRFGHKNECVYTILGRRRHLDGINAEDFKTKGYYERLSINSPIQGSAADITISAQLLIENDPILKKLGYIQLLQVHDEVVGVCPKKNKEKVAERKKYLMENCLPRPMTNVRLRADYDFGANYAEAK